MTTANHEPDPARPGPGRPRSSAADAAILDATLELLAEHGYEALTMEAVAETAAVAKSTVYRRYPGKVELVIAAVGWADGGDQPEPPLPDTGSIETDAVQLLCDLRDRFASETKSRIVPALLSATARNPQLATAHASFVARRRSIGIRMLTRAIERGQLPAATDPEILSDLLSAPVFYRSFVSRDALDDDTIRTFVRAALGM